jgi:murein DD-endopeptidase MepM/ murein hydrolase activator NlpD
MRGILAVAAAAFLLTGPASAATPVIEFAPVIEFSLGTKGPAGLPSADVPNGGGSLRLPDDFTTPPARRQQLSFPALHGLWQRAGAAYGIPWQVLASINRIESNFGQNMGPSSAGAVGWMQFMPSTWMRWGMDANGDGVSDPWNPEDAIFSAARYLAAAGGATDLPRAIFAYNHAQWYVDEVLAGAELYGSVGGNVGFTAAVPSAEVETAEAAVADLEAQLADARRSQRRLGRRQARLVARVGRMELLSHRLAADRDAAQAGFLRDDAAAEVGRLEAELTDAQAALEQARQGALTAAVAPGLAGLAPSFAGDFVFPVAGGPGVVSVGHDHHDYPAADIAAPEGTPLFALTDGYVVDAWPQANGNCGIGFTLQSGDGRHWTYCHLSYLDPTVAAGVALAAGASVGLVGSTGHSTGPHLHLQLQPATSYPQDEPWFQALAGTAFSWQDAPRADAPNVFAVVDEPAAVEFSLTDS